MSLAELSNLHLLVTRANRPEDVFSSLRDMDSREAIGDALEQEYVRLTQIATPKRYAGDPDAQSTARRILARLYELHQQALDAIGVFESVPSDDSSGPVSPGPDLEPVGGSSVAEGASFAVTTRIGSYQAERLLAEGDLSTVYLGRVLAAERSGLPPGTKVALKIACTPGENDLLLDEVRTLRLFESADGAQRKHLPSLLDQFQTTDGRAGTVFRYIEGFNLTAVHARYPQGIPPQHSVWILRRLLSVVGFAHSQGVIHGNIEPAHILVSPRDHNAFLIDWSYSLVAPARTGQEFKAHHPDYSAPEVAERKPPLPASDLYSLGKCMIMVLGGDILTDAMPTTVDERLARFIQFFVRPSPRQRAQDAWEMYEKLKQLREEVFGPHQFEIFEMY